MSDQAVNIRLPVEIHTWLKARAKSEFRTMQAEALKIISDAMRDAPQITFVEHVPFPGQVSNDSGIFADIPMHMPTRVRGGAA